MRNFHKDRPMLFKPHAWEVIETEFTEDSNLRNETLFSLGNGYLGLRGTFEEGFYGNPEKTAIGTFINGVYEYRDYHYMWKRPGFPERTHSMINVMNCNGISICLDGEAFHLSTETVQDYTRTLDLRNGILKRILVWVVPNGKKVRLDMERFVSMDNDHLIAYRYRLTALNFSSELEILSVMDGHVENIVEKKPEIGSLEGVPTYVKDKGSNNGTGFITQSTYTSKFLVAAAMSHQVTGQNDGVQLQEKEEDTKVIHRFSLGILKDKPVVFEKFVNYFSSKETKEEECLKKAIAGVQETAVAGYDTLRKQHADRWEKFWEASDMEINGNAALQQAVRFNAFHLMQAAGKDGKTNISANGLTGEGYQGHTFWDTEMYMLPFFLYTQPELAKQLLTYRYHILGNARKRAQMLENEGALFSWNSINGEECGFVFEAATAQYHINADICYAIYKYVEATEDEAFLVEYGAEILFETSRFIAHRGSFIPYRNNQFCINVVCGPDEYTPAVDNNCYTNTLTRFQLYFALKTAKMLEEKHPEKYEELMSRMDIRQDEFDLWKNAADNMYIPYSKELEMLMQDDQFLYRDPIDLESIDEERLPLLTHLHPLNLWRFQVSKQADLVLLMFLRSHEYSMEMKRKVYDFYEPKTIHDSSLSASVHSIVACDIGYYEEGIGYFLQAARMDLDDYNRNTSAGIHAACMGGTLMGIVNGFAGMRVYDGKLHFKPYLPESWDSCRFKISFRGRLIEILMEKDKVTYSLLKGDAFEIESCDEALWLDGPASVVMSGKKERTRDA